MRFINSLLQTSQQRTVAAAVYAVIEFRSNKKRHPKVPFNDRTDAPLTAACENLVGTAGFEPATPTPPVWCATRLRYAPDQRGAIVPDSTEIETSRHLALLPSTRRPQKLIGKTSLPETHWSTFSCPSPFPKQRTRWVYVDIGCRKG